jgi:hypothetical protein
MNMTLRALRPYSRVDPIPVLARWQSIMGSFVLFSTKTLILLVFRTLLPDPPWFLATGYVA